MKLRILFKREGRYYRIRALHRKRECVYLLTMQNGKQEESYTTDKMDTRFCKAAQLYYDAYREVMGYGERIIRTTSTDREATARARPIPPGRKCVLSTIEEYRK